VLDFAFQAAAADAIARGTGTDRLARVFAGDAVYEGGEAAAMQLPTFLGNHDMGRFAHFVRAANPNMGDEEQLRRVALGHALMMFSRGVPVIYYGDEQGFVGDGGDQDAREDMFASRVAVYNDNRLVGTNATTASSNFNTNAPLYRRISEMAGIRAADPALRRGRQIVRAFSVRPGLFAFSRKLEGRGETLVALNTSTSPVSARVEVDATSLAWRSSHGRCAPTAVAPGSYAVEIAALDYIVCVAEAAQ
jgi:glycosidase